MKFHFYKRKGILPSLIRYFGGGEFNHVSVEVGMYTYEAIGGKILGANGVLMSPSHLTQHKGRYEPDEVVTVEVELTQGQMFEVAAYLRDQVGKKYGTAEVFGFVFRWIRGRASTFYCSELAIRAFEIALNRKYELRYSPSEVYELVK